MSLYLKRVRLEPGLGIGCGFMTSTHCSAFDSILLPAYFPFALIGVQRRFLGSGNGDRELSQKGEHHGK
jgi:hypothetical protein